MLARAQIWIATILAIGPASALANLCSDINHVQVPEVIEVPVDFNANPFTPVNEFVVRQKGISQKVILDAFGAKSVVADAHPGSVIASPTGFKGPGTQNYQDVWRRDLALVKRVVVLSWIEALKAGNQQLAKRLFAKIHQSTLYEALIQSQDCGEGWPAYHRALVRAKYHPNGKPYLLGWLIHQSDGPALSAVTNIMIANQLIEIGELSYVKNHLYNPEAGAHTVIWDDLNALLEPVDPSHPGGTKVWQELTGDYWEERTGTHYATRLAHLDAMKRGAKLARRMGDLQGAIRYEQAAAEMEPTLNQFYNEAQGYIVASVVPGLNPDNPVLFDIMALLGVNHSGPAIGKHSALDPDVLQTFSKLMNAFAQEFPINQAAKSRIGEDLAPALGRNLDDHYDGYKFAQDVKGHSWFLATLAGAELSLKMIRGLFLQQEYTVTERSLEFFTNPYFSRYLPHPAKAGMKYQFGTPEFLELLEADRKLAASFIAQVKEHIGMNGEMSEQVNRENGMMEGVEQLTWSHAAFLSAELFLTRMDRAIDLYREYLTASASRKAGILKLLKQLASQD